MTNVGPFLLIPNAPPPLAASATYTSAFINVDAYNGIGVSCKSDVSGTLYVDWSNDGSTTLDTFTYDVAANLEDFHRITRRNSYVRIRYINDATPQTTFVLQLVGGDLQLVSLPVNRVVQRDADSTVVRTIPDFLEIATSKFAGINKNNKVGLNIDIDTGTTPEWLWAPGGVYTGFPTGSAEAIRITSSDANDTAAGTGARTVVVTGLDANWAIQSETITLSGTTPAVSANTYRRVHTAYVASSGSNTFNVGDLTIAHNVTTANVFLQISAGRNQTYAAVYTVPAGKVGCMINLKVEVDRATASSISGFVWVREFNMAPRYRRPFTASNSSVFSEDPYGGLVFPEKTDIGVVVTSCSANNTSVQGAFDIVIIDDD